MTDWRRICLMIALALWASLALGCKGRKTGDKRTKSQRDQKSAIRIGDDTRGLRFLFYDVDTKTFKRVRSRAEIPKDRRHAVIVSDPLRGDFPPAGMVVIADLRAPQKDGYSFTLVKEEQVANVFKIQTPKRITRRLLMFSTTTCPVCTRARDYLTTHKIAFSEHQLDRSPAARALLQKLAKEANYTGDLNSVPMFSVAGRILRGFDPKQIDLLLGIR